MNRRRIFLSYGHDRYTAFAESLKLKLKGHGHDVWFDADRLKSGADWERYIEQGLEWAAEPMEVGCVVLLMTPYSVRRPDGYCLNELARATAKKIPIIPVMLAACEPPLSIARIQWLDMQGCAEQPATKPFEPLFERLLDALAHDNLDFEGAESKLLRFLTPPDFSADIRDRLKDFVGRDWVFERVRAWLDDQDGPRLFWITGGPGVGKSALAAQVAQRFPEVAAFHACVHGNTDKADPRRVVMSVAYQLATQLPGYMERLALLDLARVCSESSAQTLFDNLLVQPFAAGIAKPERTYTVVIDALDEATQGGDNELARFIAKEFPRTPPWLRLVITSRPEEEVKVPLQQFEPYTLDTSSQQNIEDLQTYLRQQLVPFSAGRASQATIDAIVQRSEGVFLYVIWILRELRAIPPRLSLDNPEAFPHGLGAVYLDFFERRFGKPVGAQPPPAYVADYRPVLELVVAAREPLPVDYVTQVMGWDEYRRDEVLSELGSLFPERDGAIQPFHLSVKDWLQERGKSGPYRVNAREGHRRHAEWGRAQWSQGKLVRWPYAVAHLPSHLVQAAPEDWRSSLREILLDFDWMQAKLHMLDTTALLKDYQALPEDESCRVVSRVIRQAAHVLSRSPVALAQQLFARIEHRKLPGIGFLLKQARSICRADVLLPIAPTLAAPAYMVSLLRGHGDVVTRVALTTDGLTAVSASRDGTLRVWDVASGETRQVLRGHEGEVKYLALSVDGRTAVSASDDDGSIMRVWDLVSGEARLELWGHDGAIRHVALTADGRTAVSASWDKTLRVWDLSNGKERLVLRGHEDRVYHVALTTDGRTAISASEDTTLRVWDLESGEARQVLRGHEAGVNHVALTADGRTAISASEDTTLRVWDLESGKAHQVLRGHDRAISQVALTADGRTAVSASWDKSLRVWDLKSSGAHVILLGHMRRVSCVTLTCDGRTAVSASEDSTLRVWNLATGETLRVLHGHERMVTDVALSADGNTAVSASRDHTLRIWNLGCTETLLVPRRESIHFLTLSADGRTAVSASWDNTLQVWDLESGEILRVLRGHDDAISQVALTADGRTVVSASRDGTLRVWDLASGETRMVLRGHQGVVKYMALSADGHTAVSASDDEGSIMRVWDLPSGEVRLVLRGHDDAISQVALTADGRTAVSASGDTTLRVWDLKSGEARQVLRGHDQGVTELALTADGRTAVSASWDNTLRVWDLKSGESRQVLRGHDQGVTGLALTADGRTAVSASRDNTLRVWDLESGEARHVLQGHEQMVTEVALTADGHTAVTASVDSTLRGWNLSTGQCSEIFFADHTIWTCKIVSDDAIVVAGDHGGNVHILRRADDPWFDNLWK